jgi:general secretion pathway protein G
MGKTPFCYHSVPVIPLAAGRTVAMPPYLKQHVKHRHRHSCQNPGQHPGQHVRSSSGFTLIEIMVVVVILSLLAAVVVPQVIDQIDKARVAKAKQDIRMYETALNLFRIDNYRYPSGEYGLEALVKQPTDPTIRNWKPGGYIQGGRLRKDPWENDYQYVFPGTRGGDFDLFSLGADGQPGGEGVDADIGNWSD